MTASGRSCWHGSGGYSHAQLLALGSNGLQLGSDGQLSRDGVIVEPDESRRGVITLTPTAARSSNIAREVVSDVYEEALANCTSHVYSLDDAGDLNAVDDFRLDVGPENALFAIFAALQLGIGNDGIEAMITGAALGGCSQIVSKGVIVYLGQAQGIDLYAEERCNYLIVDRTFVYEGTRNEPDYCKDQKPSGSSLPEDDTEPDDDDGDGQVETRVYRGQVELHLVAADWSNDPPIFLTKTCDTTPDAELVVRPNGTLTFTFAWIQWVRNSGFSAPTENDCQPWERNSVFEGTWTGTTFTATIGDPLHLNPVEFEGQLAENCSVGLGRLCAVAQAELAFYGVAVSGTYGGNTGTLSFALPLVNE